MWLIRLVSVFVAVSSICSFLNPGKVPAKNPTQNVYSKPSSSRLNGDFADFGPDYPTDQW